MRVFNWWGIQGRTLLVLAVVGLLAASLTIFTLYNENRNLNGLLVDLELEGPDPSRYRELREVFTKRLTQEVSALSNLRVKLDYVHFSFVTKEILNCSRVDFLLLSPQGTPWYKYQNGAAQKLAFFKVLLKDMIYSCRTPILGVCGGHQFLALAFGGTIGFIDPALEGQFPEGYPREAMAERGVCVLETLGQDPIFEGLVKHPGRFRAMQSHYEEIKLVPQPFINLARSTLSEAQLIRIPGRPVYGVAFHPERGWATSHDVESDPNGGKQILANFMTMVVEEKRSRPCY